MSTAKEIVDALIEGDEAKAKELLNQAMNEGTSALVAAGTAYILQTAVNCYTDGTVNEGEEGDEEEGEEEGESEGKSDDKESGDGAAVSKEDE